MKVQEIKVSIVVPCYNEAGNIKALYNEVAKNMGKYNLYELILVDDGSSDQTLEEIKAVVDVDSNVKYIALSRNFGHQNALKAGLDYATGDCVISMDGDLQHPPSLIESLIDKWTEGYDVVYTIRKEDDNLPLFKRMSSKLFYKIMNKISSHEIKQGAADFRLLDRKVVDVLKNLPENFLFIRGLVSWVGFRQTELTYTPNTRYSGSSKYSLIKMIRFAMSGITSFSVKPLRISIVAGVIIALFAFVYGLYALSFYIFTDKAIQGWTSVILSVLFIGGIQLIMIGIIGEYLGKLFLENKRRPNYIVKETNC